MEISSLSRIIDEALDDEVKHKYSIVARDITGSGGLEDAVQRFATGLYVLKLFHVRAKDAAAKVFDES